MTTTVHRDYWDTFWNGHNLKSIFTKNGMLIILIKFTNHTKYPIFSENKCYCPRPNAYFENTYNLVMCKKLSIFI